MKNTFVHLCVCPPALSAAAAERRCTSVPSSARLASAPSPLSPAPSFCASGNAVHLAPSSTSFASATSEVRSARWSDVSTSADCCSDSESAGSSPKQTAASGGFHGRSRLLLAPAPVSAGSAARREAHRLPPPVPVAARQGGRGQRSCEDAEVPRLEHCAPRGSQHRGSAANAKAGSTAAATLAPASAAGKGSATKAATKAAAPVDLLRQLAMVVAAVSAAISGTGHVKSAKATEGPRGWSIIAKISAEDAEHKEAALNAARDALLRAAKDSGAVYVLGHKAEPFLSTPVGFAASLGTVADDGAACWNMINQGFCRRGTACRFEHPAHQTTVNVMVQVERRT